MRDHATLAKTGSPTQYHAGFDRSLTRGDALNGHILFWDRV